MNSTHGNGPSPDFGRAMFNWRCWLSGFVYSIPFSKVTVSGTGGSFCASAGLAIESASRAVRNCFMGKDPCGSPVWFG